MYNQWLGILADIVYIFVNICMTEYPHLNSMGRWLLMAVP